MADPLLLGPAALFVVSTAYATAVAANEPDLPGEPFGFQPPGRVRTNLTLGLGSAISAPWPMAVIATWAAVRGNAGSAWAARTDSAATFSWFRTSTPSGNLINHAPQATNWAT